MRKITLLILCVFSAGSALLGQIWQGYVDVKKDHIVEEGKVLEIMPGTVVRFASDAKLIIDGGILLAQGLEKDPIRLTSYEPESGGNDFWRGIDFIKADQDTSRIEHCVIENIIRNDGKGSIDLSNSIVKVRNTRIHNNESSRGGAFFVDNSALTLEHSIIENNTAQQHGGAVSILNSDTYLANVKFFKNTFINNRVEGEKSVGGGAVYIEELDNEEGIKSNILIQENNIISNTVRDLKGLYTGNGGGISIITGQGHSVSLIGNKIMYNVSGSGGGLYVEHISKKGTGEHIFTNNIISNNTSSEKSGGVLYRTGLTENIENIIFENNDIVNNHNTDGKSGAGGLFIEFDDKIGNLFEMRNMIFYNNYLGSEISDVATIPYTYPGSFISYSNFTSKIEGTGNIEGDPMFMRKVENHGALPYRNFLRGDYRLSLESPCVDAGDPKIPSVEPDGTIVNMGAYGNTNEATTSIFETIIYTKPVSVLVKRGETVLLNTREYKETVELTELRIEDGGQIFIASKPYDPEIFIESLVTEGAKIGDLYTTRIQRLPDPNGSELPYNILRVNSMDCTGARFSNMAVSCISPGKDLTLRDSHIYLFDFNAELTGITADAENAYIENNIIDNFNIGIYFGGGKANGKAARKGRITNNTVSFNAVEATKGVTNKGIVTENSLADIEDNIVIDADTGIEALGSSSGRITNNTISFNVSEATKNKTARKAIHLTDNSSYEVDNNRIISNDDRSTEIHALSVDNSFVNAHYNAISFSDSGSGYRYGFYAIGLSENSIFINNTVYNANKGIYFENTVNLIEIINNIFYGPKTYSDIHSDSKNLILLNNNIVGSISPGSVHHEENTLSDDPLFQSTRINDFYLWRDSKCINTGRYDERYHVYGENYYGSAPDIGAFEFWQESQFYAPQNVSCVISATTVSLSWSRVPDAVSYSIYRSDNPYAGFSIVANTSSTSWSGSTSGSDKYFYYVTASREGVKDIPYVEDTGINFDIPVVKTPASIDKNELKIKNSLTQ